MAGSLPRSRLALGALRGVLAGLLAVGGACAPDGAAPLGPLVHAAEPSPERTSLLALVRERIAAEDWLTAQQALVDWGKRHGEDGEILSLLSLVSRKRGDVASAVAFGERATQAAPGSSDAHLQYARALGEKMRAAGALSAMASLGSFKEELRRARELDPANLDARTDEIVFHLIAPGIAGGSKAKGLTLAQELVALDRALGEPLHVWALSANDRTDEAIETARASLAADPSNRRLRQSLARLYAEEERTDEALAEYEALLAGEEDALAYEARYQLARTLLQAEREPERALAALERYVEGAPASGELPPKAAAWWRIGMAHEALGDEDAARTAYETALGLDPGFEQAREALEELD